MSLHVKLLLDECLVYVILFSVQFLLILWMETNTTSYLFHYFLPFLLESIENMVKCISSFLPYIRKL